MNQNRIKMLGKSPISVSDDKVLEMPLYISIYPSWIPRWTLNSGAISVVATKEVRNDNEMEKEEKTQTFINTIQECWRCFSFEMAGWQSVVHCWQADLLVF